MFKSFKALTLLLLTVFYTTAQEKPTVKVTIDEFHPVQTIESFGASDAWGCQFAGKWPDEKRNRMAELLFSNESTKDGQPLGIGLNFWRFSIGAGSAEQGPASTIRDEWKRQASFLGLDGKYNWTAMPGQVWFLQAAKKYGVKDFLGFVNSPHVSFTLNERAYSSAGECNLDFSKLDLFTDDIVNTVKGVKKLTGIEFKYLSPVNEPQWKWADPKQEGCPYTNEELARLARNLSEKLIASKLLTKIQVGDAGQLDYLYGQGKSKGHQVNAFFHPDSKEYLGGLANVDRSISGHSYFTTSPEKKAVDIRKKVAEEVAKIKDLRYWMSEYCVLGDDSLKGPGRDLGMETALFIAKLIHHDLSISNATSWQWWLAISPGDYKDGLIYIDRNKEDGKVYDSKLLWAMGNYSRFIKPGSRRLPVTMTGSDGNRLHISSYQTGSKLVTVVVNRTKEDVNIDLLTNKSRYNAAEIHVTSEQYSLFPVQKYNRQTGITIPAQSVTTIISQR
ncbi:glycoside hydrolase [Pedobacter psychroterrae]|uniref:Xylanase n=1 Tax=Pedobacter psychroterrae TaxID=2530453 RepID=A0A4R0NDP0_9SPHI|nr:glycoside hydrolase [Pedobacter psychroterrae]TCC97383.1 xylanase [Pedobacter psychroterrae]